MKTNLFLPAFFLAFAVTPAIIVSCSTPPPPKLAAPVESSSVSIVSSTEAPSASSAPPPVVVSHEVPQRDKNNTITAGPKPSTASKEEREQEIINLLNGKVAISQLPVVSTDSDSPFDPNLRRSLLQANTSYETSSMPVQTPNAASKVTLAKVNASGSLQDSAIQRTIRSHSLTRIKKCYEMSLLINPSLQGRLTISLDINPNGSLNKVLITQQSIDQQTPLCVLASLKQATFPSASSGTQASVTFVFTNQLTPSDFTPL